MTGTGRQRRVGVVNCPKIRTRHSKLAQYGKKTAQRATLKPTQLVMTSYTQIAVT